jgi:hypothetical protein
MLVRSGTLEWIPGRKKKAIGESLVECPAQTQPAERRTQLEEHLHALERGQRIIHSWKPKEQAPEERQVPRRSVSHQVHGQVR